jgi:hypothetical protein
LARSVAITTHSFVMKFCRSSGIGGTSSTKRDSGYFILRSS